MNIFILVLMVFTGFFSTALFSKDLDYIDCGSIQDVITKETKEINSVNQSDNHELAELYVSRGESYLLDAQYDKAIEDFQSANFHMGYCRDLNEIKIIAFRIAFGEAVSYDNLGMIKQAQDSLDHLKAIVMHVGCDDCIDNHPCHGLITQSVNKKALKDLVTYAVNQSNHCYEVMYCKHKKEKAVEESQTYQENYTDILGPNEPPEPNWCEEVVTGVGRAMDAIACLAPNYAVKIVLIGVIEAMITRGVKCCQAGGFWKACVAPITRKWREWKNNKEKFILPNDKNLYLYTN